MKLPTENLAQHLQDVINLHLTQIKSLKEENKELQKTLRLTQKNSYVNTVLRKNSFEELRELFVNTTDPTKEISESYACIKNLLDTTTLDDKFILHIGDGSWCRTGLMSTFHTKSINFSVDPDANKGGRLPSFINKWKVKNFDYASARYEDIEVDTQGRDLIITGVHAHVNAVEVDRKFPNWKYFYINPCCKRSTQIFPESYCKSHGIELVLYKKDVNILTPMNEVFIYKKS